MTNDYNPDNTDAATLAAFQALGAEIAALRYQLAAQRERADEHLRTASQLDEQCRELRDANAALRDELRSELAQVNAWMREKEIIHVWRTDTGWDVSLRDNDGIGATLADALRDAQQAVRL